MHIRQEMLMGYRTVRICGVLCCDTNVLLAVIHTRGLIIVIT